MSKVIKILASVIILALVVALLIVYALVIKPNSDFVKNREKLDVTNFSNSAGTDRIHFLPTDSSDAILIESQGHFALIDCAEDSDNPRNFPELDYQGYEKEVLEYVKKVATNEDGKVHFDFVLGTHSHSDHIGGFDTLILDDDVVIDRAYLKTYDESKIDLHEVEAWDNKEVYEQMVNALNSKNIPIISQVTEPKFKLGNFDITLFNTEYDNSGKLVGENDNSFGVLVEKAGKRVFLAGDINNINGDEDRLGKQIGKVDVLKVGHHSYSKSTSAGWLRTLKPSVCVVTNDYEKLDMNTIRRITRIAHSPVLVTGKENGVIISIDDNGKLLYHNEI